MRLQSGTHLQRPASTRSKLSTVTRSKILPQWLSPNKQRHLHDSESGLGRATTSPIRREQCKTIIMYWIVNDLINIPAENYLTHSGTTTRGHGTRFLVPYCSVNAYKSSFFPSTVLLSLELSVCLRSYSTVAWCLQGLCRRWTSPLSLTRCF